MNTLITVIVTGFGAGVVPIVIAVLSYRQAKEANRQSRILENRKVDAEAFMNAQRIYQDAIATLEAQLQGSREAITLLDQQLRNARMRITELERRADASDPE